MRLGFEYGLGKNLNVGFGRSTYLKTYDVYAKGRIAGQTETFPLSIGLVAAGSVKISPKVSANLEYLHPFTDELPGSNPLSLGVDVDTGGHLFQLILSNSQQIFTQGIYTATRGNWSDGKLFFGFNLIREFRIKYY